VAPPPVAPEPGVLCTSQDVSRGCCSSTGCSTGCGCGGACSPAPGNRCLNPDECGCG
jgi:hypothetical protein